MKIYLPLALVLSILVIVPAVLAVPLFSTDFYGTVTVDGNPVPAGYIITAEVNSIQKGSITLVTAGVYGGPTGLDSKLIVNPGNTGETITFLINGEQATQTATFDSAVHELNLTFDPFCGDSYCNGAETCSSCSDDCGTCPPSDGSSPGGGGPRGSYTPLSLCTPNWECTDWSACINGEQTKTCTDSNNCGTNTNKPDETTGCVTSGCAGQDNRNICVNNDLWKCEDSQWTKLESCESGCTEISSDEAECNIESGDAINGNITTSGGNGITGAFIGLSTIGALVTVIIVIMGAIFWKLR